MAKPNTTQQTATRIPNETVINAVTEVSASAQATNESNLQVAKMEKKRKDLANEYRSQKKVAVAGSPFYVPYFGRSMPIIINGVAVYVPLDGQRYEIPETFARVFNEKIAGVDAIQKTQSRLSDIRSNFESTAGQKDLINAL